MSMIELNKVYNESCLETLSKIEDNVIDLTVTSPPYEYEENGMRLYSEEFKDNPWNEETFKKLVQELYRTTKEGGIVVWNVGDKYIDGSESCYSFKQALEFSKYFKLNDTMIWNKTNPMPQLPHSRYTQAFEYMFVFSKGSPKTFNPLKIPCKTAGTSRSSVKEMGCVTTDRIKKDIVINQTKTMTNVWDIHVCNNKTKHPAVFPLDIPLKHIQSWTNEGDLVYDPFMGSGTTALASLELKRNYIGSEISKEYMEINQSRIQDKIREMSPKTNAEDFLE